MNWRYKALLQALFATLPGGQELNYCFRRYVTKTVPASPGVISMDYGFAAEHIAAFRKHGLVPIDDALFFEFGVGWDLTIPLSFYSLGVERQIVTDLRPLLKPDLVARTTSAFQDLALQSPVVRLPRPFSGTTDGPELVPLLRRHCGIDYRAPFDARATGFPSNYVNYITATKVVSFIPPETLVKILSECHRVLRSDGLVRLLIDYRDNNSYFDRRISSYNFLRYSDFVWDTFYSSGLNYQNRMRHCDYKRLFTDAGFTILEEQAGYDGPIERACELVRLVPLAERFRTYDVAELAAVRGVFLLGKNSAQSAPIEQHAQTFSSLETQRVQVE